MNIINARRARKAVSVAVPVPQAAGSA
jgi:hypothetical protein